MNELAWCIAWGCALALLTAWALYRAAVPSTSWDVYLTVFISWVMSLCYLCVLPVDVDSDANNDTIRHFFTAVYWSSWGLMWILMPLQSSYHQAGEFTMLGKLWYALRVNLKFYLGYVVLMLIFLIIVVASHDLETNSFGALLICVSNGLGLLTAVLFMGHGLVDFPRTVWRQSQFPAVLQFAYWRLHHAHNKAARHANFLQWLHKCATQLTRRVRTAVDASYEHSAGNGRSAYDSDHHRASGTRSAYSRAHDHDDIQQVPQSAGDESVSWAEGQPLVRACAYLEATLDCAAKSLQLSVDIGSVSQPGPSLSPAPSAGDGKTRRASYLRGERPDYDKRYGGGARRGSRPGDDVNGRSRPWVGSGRSGSRNNGGDVQSPSSSDFEGHFRKTHDEPSAIRSFFSFGGDAETELDAALPEDLADLLYYGISGKHQRQSSRQSASPSGPQSVTIPSLALLHFHVKRAMVRCEQTALLCRLRRREVASARASLGLPAEVGANEHIVDGGRSCYRWTLRGAFLVLVVCACVVWWSELTVVSKHTQLSPLGYAVQNSSSEWEVQLWSLLTLSLMFLFTTWATFKLRIGAYYEIHMSGHATESYSLLLHGMYALRLATSLAYHFLAIVHSSHSTAFEEVLGKMDLVPFFGTSMNVILPMGISVLAILCYFDVYERVARALGFSYFAGFSSKNELMASAAGDRDINLSGAGPQSEWLLQAQMGKTIYGMGQYQPPAVV